VCAACLLHILSDRALLFPFWLFSKLLPVAPGAMQVGRGFFPRAALFNHSCLPNCVPIYQRTIAAKADAAKFSAVEIAGGGFLCVRVCRPIRRGDACVISYIEPYDHFLARSALPRTKFVLVSCRGCTRGGHNYVHRRPSRPCS